MNIKVEIFASPHCGKCKRAKEVLRKLAEELSDDAIELREVNVLEEIDYAVELGVLSTPSIAINNKLVFSSLPSKKILRSELLKQLNIFTN